MIPPLRALVLSLFLGSAAFQLHAQTNGALDLPYNPNLEGSSVLAVAIQADGKSIVGGSFTSVAGSPHLNLARLNADGSVDAAFKAGTNGDVTCLAVQPNGKILVGGSFSEVNGQPRKHIARLNADGSLEDAATFNNGIGPNGAVLSVAAQPDGKILIGGQFTEVNGQPVNHIARLNADGSVENSATFNSGLGPNERVYSLAVQKDGKILLGGAFREVNGQPRNHIARLEADGRVDGAFQADPGANTAVRTVAVQPDGRILIGGEFIEFNGQPCGHLARLEANGRLDRSFRPGTGANNTVLSVAVQQDGNIVLGGAFDRFDGKLASHIVQLNADGGITVSFGTGADNTVQAVALQNDGKILLGGAFNEFNGAPRGLVARLVNAAANQ